LLTLVLAAVLMVVLARFLRVVIQRLREFFAGRRIRSPDNENIPG
jgi:hypothetical protein